nr:type II CAAX endopeptidase family protein [Loktanella sp. SALINAS62]
MSGLCDRNRFRSAWAALAILSAILIAPVLLQDNADRTDGTGQLDLTANAVTVLFQWGYAGLVVFTVWLMGWLRSSSLIGRSDPAGLRLFSWFLVPLGLFYLAILSAAVRFPADADVIPTLIWTLLFAMGIGVSEEVMFRGILMHGLRARYSAGRALLICSAVFSVAHVANTLSGQSAILTLNQVAFTFAFGALLGAITLQTASLWPAIVLHGLWNTVALSAMQIEDPMQASDPATAAPLGPVITWGSTATFAAFVAGVGWLALVVFRRWRVRTATAGRRPPPLPTRE